MLRPLTTLSRWPPAANGDFVDGEFAAKAGACARTLKEARRLAQLGNYGQTIHQLVSLACDLLDEIDEILVVLDSTIGGEEFAATAALHRQLEHVQAEISANRRGLPPESNTP